MDTKGQQLAEAYLEMLNTHEPDLVDGSVAEAYRDHDAFVADGREANQEFWTAFFSALPDPRDHRGLGDLRRSGGGPLRLPRHPPGEFMGCHPATRSRCAPSTSGVSRTACSSNTGTN